ncbi:MAG: glycoside hydrolase domain-containing protein [Chitinophagaceae bacterium]
MITIKKTGAFLLPFVMLLQLSHAQQIKYTAANNSWNADSLGNHRAVITCNAMAKLARVIIEWRRHDENPDLKGIIVQDAKTGARLQNVLAAVVNREYGDIYFEPLAGSGKYYVYYMPYRNEGRSNYPKGVYLKPDALTSPEWLQNIHTSATKPNAFCKEIQSIDAFNSFYPMEVIATANETESIKKKYAGNAFVVFPEDRMHPIRMKADLPQRWIEKGAVLQFKDGADKGENYSFQLGVYALQNLQDLQVTFSDLKTATGNNIEAKNILCINTDGTAYNNRLLKNRLTTAAGTVQPLWCTLQVPVQATAGLYKGVATVKAAGVKEKKIALSITVSSHTAINNGVNEPQKMTRLAWLNSTLAQTNEVIAPYTPLQADGNSIGLLGRKLELNNDGFPRQIQTFFTEEMTTVSTQANDLFVEPVHFHFTRAGDGKDMKFKNAGLQFTKKEPGTIEWKAITSNDTLEITVTGALEFDGFMSYEVKVTALQDADMKEITMHLPFKKEATTYLMGLGQKGGLRPDTVDWKWDVANKNQDGAWIGAVNAGLQYSLRDEKYIRPLNTNFYLQQPLVQPSSWANDGKGGITVFHKGSSILANNYSGKRFIKKGAVLYYNFTLLITPFHTLNTDFQWSNRFYHKYNNLEAVKATGATVVNIHHATPVNPWINYPFIEWKKMKAYIDTAHSLRLKVKIYNTVRELSDHAYETAVLRSLGHEVYSPGKGGGFSWLQEHLDSDYIAAWFVPGIKDAAIINSGMNRWHNYYVEGMNWLTQKVGIDGIYLDDVAFDRITMKRIKRVLTKDNHPGIIDLHSANQYNKNDGFNNSAMLYMEHFPYLNRLWFGEYFDYEKNDPGFFLTEVSGIPFGLMGEMLQGDGNPWRGMIYGMTSRLGWSNKSDPQPIWKLWHELEMKGTEMIGYWSSQCPVKTSNEKVLVTVYKKKGLALLSIASWADSTAQVKLQIDWKSLGIDESKATLTAPAIADFQQGHPFAKEEMITVEKNKGLLLVLKE